MFRIFLDFTKKHSILVLAMLVVFPLFMGWFISGTIVGADFQVRSNEYLGTLCGGGTWDDLVSGGTYTVEAGNIAKQPIYFASCALSHFTDYSVNQKIVWLYPLLGLLVLAPYIYARHRAKSKLAIAVAVIIFALSPALLERIHRSHVWLGLVVALFPIALVMIEKEYYRRLSGIISLSVLTSLLFWIETRMALLALVILTSILAFQEKNNLKRCFSRRVLLMSSVAMLIIVSLNLFWILPTIFRPPVALYDNSIASREALNGAGRFFGSILNSLLTIPENWRTPLSIAYMPVALMWVSVAVFTPKLIRLKNLTWYAVLLLVLVFLGKGTHEPASSFNLFLLEKIPLFVSFRNSTKFVVFTSILTVPFAIALFDHVKVKYGLKPQIALFVVTILSVYAGCYFLIYGVSNGFSGDPAKYGNEPNMFMPVSSTQIDEVAKMYESLAEHGSNSYLTFPRDQRYRLVTNNVREIKLNEADKQNGLVTGENGILTTKPDYIYNHLRLMGAQGVILQNGRTPEWRYNKSLGYSDVLEMLLASKDTTMLRTYARMGTFKKIDGTNAQINGIGIKTNYGSKHSLVISIRYPIGETVDTDITFNDLPQTKSSYSRSLTGTSSDRLVVFNLPDIDINKIDLSIRNVLSGNQFEIQDAYLIEQISNAFIAHPHSVASHNIEVPADSGTYSSSVSDSNVPAVNKSVRFPIQVTNTDDAHLKLNIQSRAVDNVAVTLRDSKQVYLYRDIELQQNGSVGLLAKMPQGHEGRLELILENVLKDNILAVPKASYFSTQLLDPPESARFQMGIPSNVNPNFVKCEMFPSYNLSQRILIKSHGANDDYSCDDTYLEKVYGSLGTITHSASGTTKMEANISRVGPGRHALLMNTDYYKYWELRIKPSGKLLEHVQCNWSQNAWIIDIDQVCAEDGICSRNSDQTYNIDLVAEFTPQRYFNIGLVISGTTLAGCIGCLVYDYAIRPRRKTYHTSHAK